MNKKILTDKELIALTILSYDRPGFPQPEDEDDVNFERQQREAYEFLELDKSNRGWDEDSDIANIAETKIRNSHGLENSIADPRLDFFDGTTSNVVQQIAEVQAKVFVNAADKVVVIGVQGSDFPNIPDSDTYSNWKSDIWNSGASEYKKIEPLVDEILKQVKQEYPGFTVVVSGHSLAGGVAQTYALKNSLDFAILDSLPIPPDSIRDVFGGDEKFLRTVEEWRANGHQGRSVIVENEIATTFYSDIKREFYLDNDPTILPNSYGPYGDYYSSRLSVILSGPPGLIPFSVLRGLDHAGGVAWDLVKDAPIDFKGRAVTDPSLWPVTQTTNLSDGSTLITRGDNYRAVISEDGKEFRFEIGDTVIYQTATSLWQKNPDGSVVVNKINGAGEWELRNYTPEQVRNEYINDPFDPENDGVGVWDGTTAGMDISDLDSQFDDANIPGLVWGRETVSRFKTGNVNDSMVDPITGIPKYLDPASANSVRDWSNLTKSEFDNLAEAGVRAGQQGLALITAIQNGKELTALDAGIKLALELDHALDVGGDGFISDAGSSNLATASSAITFANAIDNQNWGRALSSGYQLGDKLEFFDGNASSARGVSAITSAYNLYSSIQNGDEFGSVVSAYTLYNSFSSTPIPGGSYLGYVNAAMQLIDGDVEGAAISAATTYVTTVAANAALNSTIMQGALSTANPYAIAAAVVVVAVLAIANSGDEPDPEASLRFDVDADGNIVFNTDANKTGDGLAQQLNGLGGVLAQRIAAFEQRLPEGVLPDNKVDISALPDIVSIQNQVSGGTALRLTGGNNMGGSVLILTGGAEELINIMPQLILYSNFQDSWITRVQTIVSENGQVFVDTQANPFGNPPSFSIAQGTGVFVGGGNVGGSRELVIATDDQIRNLAPRPARAVEKELAEVSKTWRVEKGVFDGPGGQLLAAGIATGLMSINDAYADSGTEISTEQPVWSLFDNEVYRALLNSPDSNLIAAGNGRLQKTVSSATEIRTPAEVYQGEFSSAFLQGYDGSYVDNNNRPADVTVQGNQNEFPDDIVFYANSNPENQKNVADQQADLIRELAQPGRGRHLEPAVIPVKEILPPTLPDSTKNIFQSESRQLNAGIADRLTVIEDREVYTTVEALLANDVNNAGKIQFIGLSTAVNGQVSINAAGDIRFIPEADFSGEAGFSYLIADETGLQQTVQVMVTVVNVNDAPQANDDAVLTGENSMLDLQVLLQNDRDLDNDEMRLLAISQVNNGRIIIGKEGSYQFIPDKGFTGETQLTYVVEDANGARSVAAAQIFVGIDNTVAISSVNVLPGDADDLSVAGRSYQGSDAGTGAVILSANETDNVFDGLTDRDYRQPEFNLTEDESRLFTASVLLGEQAGAVTERLNIIAVRMQDDAQGQLRLTADGDVRFTPAENLTGVVAFEYDVSDGESFSTVQASVKIWPVNDAPETRDDSFNALEDSELTLSGAALLANDTDIEGNALRIVGIWGTSSGASASYDAQADALSFTPENDMFGSAWVDFLVEDENGAWAVERADLDITNVDDPAIAVDDAVSLLEDQSRIITAAELTANDINLDKELLRINSIDTSGLTHGQAVLLASGDIRFTPQADFAGIQTLDYELIDESNNVSSARITLDIQQVNDAPVVTLSTASAYEDERVSFEFSDLLMNASDIEGDSMQVVGVRTNYGKVSIDEANQRISFQASRDFNSSVFGTPAVVEYLVADEYGASSWGAINVDVLAVNDAPVAGDDVLFAWSGGPAAFINQLNSTDLLANDNDVDGEAVWVDKVGQGNFGTVSFDQATGVISYRADTGFTGTDRFNYRITDGVADSYGQGVVQVEVLENTAPVATDFVTVAEEDTVLRFDWADFKAYVSDRDLLQQELPEQLKLVSVENALNGSVSMNPDGSVSFNPIDNFNSAQNGMVASFDYVVSDIVGNTTQATVSIDYTPVNDDPVARPDGLPAIDEDSPGLIFSAAQLLLNDSDVDIDGAGNRDVDNLIVNVGSAAHGRLSDLGNGQFRYTPDTNYNGPDRFSYTVVDGNGGSDNSYAEINVLPVNDNPVAEIVRGSGNDLNTNRLSGVLDRAFDIDGDSLSLKVTGVSGGVGSAYASGGDILWRGAAPGGGTIYYDVLDGKGGVASSQANVSIAHANRAPVIEELKTTYFERADVQTRYNGGVAESRFHVEVHGFIRATDSDGYITSYFGDGPAGFRMRSDGSWSIELGWSNWFRDSFNQTFNYKITAYDNEYASVSRSFGVTVSVNAGDRNAAVLAPPLLFDLNANGFELDSYKNGSDARFDVDGDGSKELSSWMAGGDGLLAIDINNDGIISQTNEISFIGYVDGAKTDLEGLHFFDSDSNGELSANDAQWNQFGLWIDENGDGTNDEGEWQKLDDIGIATIQLSSDGIAEDLGDGNQLYGSGQFTWQDGTTGKFADIGLSYQDESEQAGITVTVEEYSADESSISEDEAVVDESFINIVDRLLDDEVEVRATDNVDGDETDINEADDSAEKAGNFKYWKNTQEELSKENSGNTDSTDSTENNNDTVSSSLPSDEELDRMAMNDVEAIVSLPPVETVTAAPEHADNLPVLPETSFDEDDDQHLAA